MRRFTIFPGEYDRRDEVHKLTLYAPSYPSAATHRLMADYIEAVFEQCQS